MINLKKIQMLPAREQVASILRSSILSGGISKGQSITLDSVGEQVGMSRTPVREAFQILANEGLLELRQNRCAIVKGISEEAIKDHYEMRILLETEALRRACEHMNDETLKAIQSVNKQGQRAKDAGDTEAYNLANQAFHMTIWEAADSEKLKSFLSLLWNGLSMNRLVTAQEYAGISLADHNKIVEQLTQKDYAGACETMRQHIIYSMNSTLSNFK
ncbi:GntR family transcriptional regulator [Sulfurospirillum diekertiae]|uniref:D-xylose utilization operon transcriptional repressor n=1 Tax=Sulfurospirillum diekertiae TaxID=1854492 RepID=A0A1Y0HIM3_9BACT|nr:GntR family transcriptional regulator [Sulfurospirillum diekertiae]ARU47205.1 putative D-xylose utilization operon transcriptional repressor [Sulfurospirillum diekertiae]ASC92061.1 putative D-xylose utilization operon transcriptional repressor [Sulfurospirillum diekertiae]